MLRAIAMLALFLPAAVPVQAQGPRLATFPSSYVIPPTLPLTGAVIPDTAIARPDELGMALGGLLAGVTGLVAGAYLGAAIDRSDGCSDDWCGLGGALVGASAGTAFMVPVGVHLANRQRGNFGLGVWWSTIVTAAGWGIAVASDNATPLVLIPLAQIAAAVAAEARTTPVPGR